MAAALAEEGWHDPPPSTTSRIRSCARVVLWRGVAYDVGTDFGWGVSTRPSFSPDLTRRELEIVGRDLHCNAVKIGGRDPARIAAAAAQALELGLEVWFSPALFEKSPSDTLRFIVDAARVAETVRGIGRDKLVFCLGQELTLFMRGILPGHNLLQRFKDPANKEIIRTGSHRPQLNAFLAQASSTVREVFQGPVTYAALPWEGVDWSPFDMAGVDHYWDVRIQDRYLEMLQPFFASGKPVVVTGTGSRAYQGAHSTGTLGFGVIDPRTLFLHTLPLVGRFIRPRLKGSYVRDEGEQARRLTQVLSLLDEAHVAGVFVDTFVEYNSPYSEDPRYDLDMSALSLVKTYERGRGTTYPEMSWEPKQAFRAVAKYYSTES